MADHNPLLLRDLDAAAFAGVSRSSFWRAVGRGIFPKPLKVGGLTRWRVDELRTAIDKLTAERDGRAA